MNVANAFKARILIVDRQRTSTEELQSILSTEGYDVVTAGTVQEAIDQFHAGPFDAIICDLILPDGSGLNLLTTIRGSDPDAVVLLMGTHITPSVILEAVSRGALDLLYKPFLSSTIAKKMAHLLGHNARLHPDHVHLGATLRRQNC